MARKRDRFDLVEIKGFVDITMRDEFNNNQFKTKRKPIRQAIKEFEDFLERKYGVKGFSAWEKK